MRFRSLEQLSMDSPAGVPQPAPPPTPSAVDVLVRKRSSLVGYPKLKRGPLAIDPEGMEDDLRYYTSLKLFAKLAGVPDSHVQYSFHWDAQGAYYEPRVMSDEEIAREVAYRLAVNDLRNKNTKDKP